MEQRVSILKSTLQQNMTLTVYFSYWESVPLHTSVEYYTIARVQWESPIVTKGQGQHVPIYAPNVGGGVTKNQNPRTSLRPLFAVTRNWFVVCSASMRRPRRVASHSRGRLRVGGHSPDTGPQHPKPHVSRLIQATTNNVMPEITSVTDSTEEVLGKDVH